MSSFFLILPPSAYFCHFMLLCYHQSHEVPIIELHICYVAGCRCISYSIYRYTRLFMSRGVFFMCSLLISKCLSYHIVIILSSMRSLQNRCVCVCNINKTPYRCCLIRSFPDLGQMLLIFECSTHVSHSCCHADLWNGNKTQEPKHLLIRGLSILVQRPTYT